MDPPTNTTPSSPQFYKCQYGRVEVLTGDNYLDWSATLTHFLIADDTWDIIQGIETAPELPENANATRRREYNDALRKFNIKSAKAYFIIFSSLSLHKKKTIYRKKDSRNMWNTLKA